MSVVPSDARPFRTAIAVLACMAATTASQRAQAAGGAFAVDDAEVGVPGSCKVESWASFASNSDLVAVTSPACVANIWRPVEIGGQFQRFRSGDEWGTTFTLKGKTNLVPIEPGKLGIALSGGVTIDLVNGETRGVFLIIPLTFQINEQFRININGGWARDPAAAQHFAIAGAGFEWNFVKPLTLITEVFAVAGSGQRNPRFQTGLRYTPIDNLDIDVIYGRNITGENADWITVGLNVRFSAVK